MKLDRRGFTLIELIIVIVIIGVLASIAAPMMSGMSKKAMAAEAIAALIGVIRDSDRFFQTQRKKGSDPINKK